MTAMKSTMRCRIPGRRSRPQPSWHRAILRDRRLPDKAIDLLDEAGAAVALVGKKRVSVGQLERVLSTMAQIPERRVKGGDRERLQLLESELKHVVFGQDGRHRASGGWRSRSPGPV